MVLCAVVNCSNRNTRDKEKRFFRLPAVVSHQGERTLQLSKERRETWLARIKREDLKPNQYEYLQVCSDHFISGAPAKLYDSDNPVWAPSVRLGHSSSSRQCSLDRYQRSIARKKRRRVCDGDNYDHVKRTALEPEESVTPDEEPLASNSLNDDVNGTLVQTELTVKDIHVMESKISELHKSQEQIEKYSNDTVADLKMKIVELEHKVDDLLLDEKSFIQIMMIRCYTTLD